MKKIIAVAGLFALAACGGSEAEGDAAAGEDATAVEEAGFPSAAGTYTMTAEDGTVTTWALSEDGSFTETVGADVTTEGTWSDEIRGTCLVAAGSEGEACYNIVSGEDGTTEVTGPDGETMTMMKGE